MKTRKFLLCVALSALLLVLAGCAGGKYEVSFDLNYAGAGAMEPVKSGAKLEKPAAPVREGYVLMGWYEDAALTDPWEFDTEKVTGPMTLYAGWDIDTGDSIQETANDKDFTSLRTPGSQEEAYEYRTWFLPKMVGTSQPYVGDPMPFYEDGVYYVYYLKDGGDSLNHSIFLATTTDFVTWEEQDGPVLEASRSGGQDGWIGTGSVTKINGKYYFFYTAHASGNTEFKETIRVAVGDTPRAFTKLDDWEIKPPASLGQKNDFRDPQAYYDEAEKKVYLTVTAAQDGVARILKYTLSEDLRGQAYDGIIYTNKEGSFWNLECSDTFKLGDKWYLTYSAQDDTLWYAFSDTPYGPYNDAKRIDGKLFYAAKHVESENGAYMVGWARRSESPSSTQEVSAWGGNLVVQKLDRKEDGTLVLLPVDTISDSFSVRRPLVLDNSICGVKSGSAYSYIDVFTCYERFKLSGDFTFTGKGAFGLAFDFSGKADKYKLISVNPDTGKLQLLFNEGSTLITETDVELKAGETYSFTYIQEGSVGIFYVNGEAALTVRVYGASGKAIKLFATDNTVTFTSLREYTA